MLTLTEKLRWLALILFMLGLSCMPFPRMNPKLASAAFSALTTTGWFVWLGLATMALALLVLLASFLVKR